MPPSIALCVFAVFVLWLLVTDAKAHAGNSLALWIPIVWVFIIGSRPVSLWLGIGADAGSYQEDGLLDKGLYFFLIAAGVCVLLRRGTDWRGVFAQNKWLTVYFLYLGISVFWADDTLVSFKRWIKDVGNVVMVLIVLSEEDPIEAVRTLLARSAYLMIPLSVLLIKYYPSMSRYYMEWSNRLQLTGVSTNKNSLGMTLFMCGLPLVWMLLELRDPEARERDRTAAFRYAVLLGMTVWLLWQSQSATAIGCTCIGCGVIVGMRLPVLKEVFKRLGAITLGIVAVIVLLQAAGLYDELIKEIASIFGRDATMHGRSNIWQEVLSQDINPLIGAGYYSFWTTERMQELKLLGGFHYFLNEAHNGYIETYLNSGLIGVVLLVTLLAVSARNIQRQVTEGASYGALQLAFWISIVIYNLTESTFNRLSPVWFALLLITIEYPHTPYEILEEDAVDTTETYESVPSSQVHLRIVDGPASVGSH
jgi:exopolysaccharide production protein ExoQ